MSSLVVAELGTKENPHPITPPVKDRIKGHYYIYKNEVRYWNGWQMINKELVKERKKKYYEKNKEKWKPWSKEYYKKNKDKKIFKERRKKYREKYKKEGKVKEWREKNKEHIKEYDKKYRENNKELIKERRKKYRENNKERIRERKKKYRALKTSKEKRSKYRTERYKNDKIYRLLNLQRSIMSQALKQNGASKNQRTMEYIHCSVAHLYYHIEEQFGDSGMNWDNMGKEDGEGGRGWEIDHRRPCASFDLNDEEQKYMCFHWTNLQPMWGQENNEKSNSYDPKTFRYKWIDREIGWVGIPKYLMNK